MKTVQRARLVYGVILLVHRDFLQLWYSTGTSCYFAGGSKYPVSSSRCSARALCYSRDESKYSVDSLRYSVGSWWYSVDASRYSTGSLRYAAGISSYSAIVSINRPKSILESNWVQKTINAIMGSMDVWYRRNTPINASHSDGNIDISPSVGHEVNKGNDKTIDCCCSTVKVADSTIDNSYSDGYVDTNCSSPEHENISPVSPNIIRDDLGALTSSVSQSSEEDEFLVDEDFLDDFYYVLCSLCLIFSYY